MPDPENEVQFAISLRPDRDGFLRRNCSACGREFKTEINDADLQWEMASQCRRMGVSIGDESHEEPPQIRCPYCAHEDSPSETHTPETVAYLKRLVYREVVIPQLNRFTSQVEDMFPGGGHSGGFISLSLEFNRSRISLPPRPLHGPEPPDFKTIEFLCCGHRIKVADAWNGIDCCSYCGAAIAVLC
jgi:DNA-directed RNA polymerase subunit RPC12/RpoP